VGIGDYVADSGPALAPMGYEAGVQDFCNPHRSHEFNFGIGEILTALLGSGLKLARFVEYPYSNGCKQFNRMRELEGFRMAPPADLPSLPLMYGLVATKA
jgi:hypothetical protein